MENLNIREDVSDIVNKTELLADLQIGFWIIEYPNDGIPKMYGDTIMYSLLGGNSNTLTPEELYSFCMERIDSEYIGLVFDAIENIKKNKRTEIRYPWRHEEKGWTWVRCGGFLDKSYKNGIRFKGYYHDITEELEMDIKNNEHKIIDFKKLRLYSPYFIENCEGLFEIDIDSLEIKTIFYKKKKYHKIDDGDNVFSVIRKWTHPNDITRLDNIFVSASLEQIINKKKIKQIICLSFFLEYIKSINDLYITSIAEAGTHPTFPSSSRISFHSFIELSLTLTFLPSWRINKLVPLSLGVLRTVTLGFITIASLRLTKCSFCCEAKRLEQTVTISKMIPDMNPIFFNIICLENIKK